MPPRKRKSTAAAGPALTVVDADTKPPEPPEKKPPTTLVEAIDASERDLLVVLRSQVAADLDRGVPAAYRAQHIRQLRELDAEIRALDARAREGEGDDVGRAAGTPDEAWDDAAI